MRRIGTFRFLFFLPLILMPAIAHAQWTADGVALTKASGTQQNPGVSASNGSNLYAVWEDSRNSGSTGVDIYAQRTDQNGNVMWAADGVPVCTALGNQGTPVIVGDGIGGIVVIWTDLRNGNLDVYAQELNSFGVAQWTANGVAVCTAAGAQSNIDADGIPGGGDIVVTWQDARSGGADIYAQKLNMNGTMAWAANGLVISSAANVQEFPKVGRSTAGEIYFTWQDLRNGGGNYDIYAQYILSNGTIQGTANGFIVCSDPNPQVRPDVVSDGQFAVVIAWQDGRVPGPGGIYAQRVSSTFTGWTANGVQLRSTAGAVGYPVVSSNNNGAVVTWTDYRNGNADIYSQSVNGSAVWTPNGVPVCTAAGNQTAPAAVSDGGGGTYVVWTDARGATDDLYVQHLDTSGVVWAADGVPLCTANGNQGAASAIESFGHPYVVWHDDRNPTRDIYGQQMTANLLPPVLTSTNVALPAGVGNALVADVDAVPRNTGSYGTRTFVPYSGNLHVLNTVTNTLESSVALPSAPLQGGDFQYAPDGLHGVLMTSGHLLFYSDITATPPTLAATIPVTDTPVLDQDPSFIVSGGNLYCVVPYLGSVVVYRLTGSTVTNLYTVTRTSVGIESVDPGTDGTHLFIPNVNTLDFVTLSTGAMYASVTLNYPPKRETDLIWDPVGGRAWWPLDGAMLRINPAGFIENEFGMPGSSVEGVDLAIKSVPNYPFRVGAFPTNGYVNIFDMQNGSLISSCPTPGTVMRNFDPLILPFSLAGPEDGIIWWSVVDKTYVIDVTNPWTPYAVLDTPGGLVDGCDLTLSNNQAVAVLPHPGFVHVLSTTPVPRVLGTIQTPGDLLTDVDPVFPTDPSGAGGSRVVQPHSGGLLVISGFTGSSRECVLTTTANTYVLNTAVLGISATYPLGGLTEGIDPVVCQGVTSPFDFSPETARDNDQDFVCHEDQLLEFSSNRYFCHDPLTVACFDLPSMPWFRGYGLPRLSWLDPLTRIGATVLWDQRTIAFHDHNGNLMTTVVASNPIVGGIVPNPSRSYFSVYQDDKKRIDIEMLPLSLTGTPQTATTTFPDAILWPPGGDHRDGIDLGLSDGGTKLALVDARNGVLLQSIDLPNPAIYPPVVDYKNQVASVLLRSRQRAILNLRPTEQGGQATVTYVPFYGATQYYPVGNTVYDFTAGVAMNLYYDPGSSRYGIAYTNSLSGTTVFNFPMLLRPWGAIFHEPKSRSAEVPTFTGQKYIFDGTQISWGGNPVVWTLGPYAGVWRYRDVVDFNHHWQVGIHGPNRITVIDDYKHNVVADMTTAYPIMGPAVIDPQNQYAEVRLQNGYVFFIDLFKLGKGDPGYYRYDFHSQLVTEPVFDPAGGLELTAEGSTIWLRRPRSGQILGSSALPAPVVRPLQMDPLNRMAEAILADGSVYQIDLSQIDGMSPVSPPVALVSTGGAALLATDVTPPAAPNLAGITISPIGTDGVAQVVAPPGTVEPSAYVLLVNRSNKSVEPLTLHATNTGGFTVYPVVATGDTVCITAVDVAGNTGPEACLPITVTQSTVDEKPPFVTLMREPSPNPARGPVMLEFSLAQAGSVTIDIHDVSGRLVRRLVNGRYEPGWHSITWDGRSSSGGETGSGVYFVRMASADKVLVKRLVRIGG